MMADADSGSQHMASAMTQAERDNNLISGPNGTESHQQRINNNPALASEMSQIKKFAN